MKKYIALALVLCPLALLAAEVVPVVAPAVEPVAEDILTKHSVIGFLLALVVYPVLQWLKSWIDNKGAQVVVDELKKVQAKINENSLVGQIAADDALFAIVENAIPEVIHELSDTLKNDLKDGKLNAVDWKDFAARVWAKIEPQVKGGANDYLKQSSFADGKVLAELVIKRFFSKQKAAAAGVIAK